ncbi:MAG: ECF-type sigma factor [Planctomycetota bacterium]
MNARNQFERLIEEVRQGNQSAAAELMRLYEPHVRRAIRLRLRDRGLRQFLDSIDISQSVMGNFFAHLHGGKFKIESPNELIGLLVRMAQNRVTDWVRHGQAQRNDYRRSVTLDIPQMVEASTRQADPVTKEVEAGDLMSEVRRRLPPLESRLLERRIRQDSWQDIAESEGGSAEALRTRLRRSLMKIGVELGLRDEP